MTYKKFLVLPFVALVMGGGALAITQVGSQEGDPPVTTETTITPPTVIEDWCEFMGMAFGPDTGVLTVRAAFDTSIANGTATPEAAYVAILEGIPPEIEPDFAMIRTGGLELSEGTAPADPDGVLASASAVDAFRDSHCRG